MAPREWQQFMVGIDPSRWVFLKKTAVRRAWLAGTGGVAAAFGFTTAPSTMTGRPASLPPLFASTV